MAVIHLMSLGTSPGVVTSALSYINKKKEQQGTKFFQGSSSQGKPEAVLLFTTKEVWEGRVRARKVCWNNYGSNKGKKEEGQHVVEVIRKFVTKELKNMPFREYPLWICLGDKTDIYKNLTNLSKALLCIAGGKTGKEIWVNLTGGTNILNFAILIIANLTGIFSRIYYTFVPDDYQCFLQPVSESEFTWQAFPIFKAELEKKDYHILKILKEKGPLQVDKLYSHLKSQCASLFKDLDPDELRQRHLLKLRGRQFLQFDENKNENTITESGEQFLSFLEDENFSDLVFGPERRLSEEESGLIKWDWEKRIE